MMSALWDWIPLLVIVLPFVWWFFFVQDKSKQVQKNWVWGLWGGFWLGILASSLVRNYEYWTSELSASRFVLIVIFLLLLYQPFALYRILQKENELDRNYLASGLGLGMFAGYFFLLLWGGSY